MVIIFSIIVVAFLQSATAMDQQYGIRKWGHNLLQSYEIDRNWSLKGIVEESLHFEDEHHKITSIEIFDQYGNNIAEAKIVGGGVNYNYVDIKFKSRWFRGIHCEVNIYGIGNRIYNNYNQYKG